MLLRIYLIIFKIYSLFMKVIYPEIADVWFRNSLKLGYWSFGESDIDITILLKKSNSSLIKQINQTHVKIKRFLPIIGEVVFFSENLKEVLIETVNSLELRRDPVLMEKYSLKKEVTLSERSVFLHKFIIANSVKSRQLEQRSKKKGYYSHLLGIEKKDVSFRGFITTLAELNDENSENFTQEYMHYLNETIYNINLSPECIKIHCLFFNKIFFLDFKQGLTDADQNLLESTILWELWGCYSTQTFDNEKQVREYFKKIFAKLNNYLPIAKVIRLKIIAIQLELLH